MGKKPFNTWKLLFWIIVLGNIGIAILLWGGIVPSTGGNVQEHSKKSEQPSYLNIDISTSKKDLELMINDFLQERKDHQGIQYEVFLNENVEIEGTIEIFSKQIYYNISLTPEVVSNGNLLLRPQNITFGELQVPVHLVFNHLKQDLFPEWVQVHEREPFIYLDFTNIIFKEKYRIEVDKFDLAHDDLKFKIIANTKDF